MEKLRYNDIVDIIYGATLMGGGGGGSMSSGVTMLENYAKTHGGESEVSVDLCAPEEMQAGSYSAVTAGMGAPTLIPDDFSPWIVNAFNFYKYVQEYSNKKIGYSMAVEMGGFNTFVPMLVSLENSIPFLDVDGAARAVPALTTLLFAVNGYDTLPIVLADHIDGSGDYDKVLLDFPGYAKDAKMAESAARAYIAQYMNGIAGLSGWLTGKADFDAKKLPVGSVSRAKEVGYVLRNAPSSSEVFERLMGKGIVNCRDLGDCVVAGGETEEGSGFDFGYILLQSTDTKSGYFRIDFQNENLVISGGTARDQLTPVMTAPDIICSFEIKSNTPLTNADYFDKNGQIIKDLKVRLGLIQVSDVWWYSDLEDVNAIWKEYFAHVGYTGNIIKFTDVNDDGKIFG